MEDGIISTNGRIRRSTYLLRWACIKIPYWIIKALLLIFVFGLSIDMDMLDILETIFGVSIDMNMLETDWTLVVLLGLLYLAMYILQLILLLPQIVKRLHDMDKSGWLALLFLLGWIPYIGLVFNLIFFLFLIAVDGTIGENYYGEDPKQRIPYHKFEQLMEQVEKINIEKIQNEEVHTQIFETN